jgi:hypothetical protein
MMTISIGKADAECPEKVTLTSGMVNAVQIVFSFSEHWDEFKKIAVFSNGATTLDVPLDEESKCFVPHEVLEVAGKEVSVGVYGSKGEGSDYVAIPTEKCSLGKVVEGVNPTGDEAAEPTPTVLDDLILRVENLEKNGGGGGTSGNVPTKLSELEADSISRSDQEPFDFSAYIANFAGHEAEFSFDNLTFRNMGYGSGVSFDGQPLHDVGAPTSDNDVANKKFVDNKETTHNTSTTAHNDIRQLISGLTSRLNAVANSDDTTLDQLSEIVAYIKANKSLIDSITTSKVNVSDIIDNLTTSVSNKPLSAKMGVELKKLIDAIKIPTTLPASDVYSWAKQPTKPTYTAEEVGAATPAYVDNETMARENAIADLKAQGVQQTPLFVKSVAECTDTTKVYVLPDGYIYAYMYTERPAYTNVLTTAIDTDGTPYNGGLGYKVGRRIFSSLKEEDVDGYCCTGYIPVAVNDVIRIKKTTIAPGSGGMHLFYNASFAQARFGMYENYEEPSGAYNTKPDENGVITLTIPSNGSTPVAYYRYSTGVINDASIITINQEITDETIKEYAWVNTGRAFVPADYEDRILELETASDSHESRIATIENVIESGDFDDKTFEEKINGFRYWDRAIFDRMQTYTLDDESKDALTDAMMTSESIYQKYDELMTLANSEREYITKTLLGQDEAGYDVYRYDFKMPEQPRLEGAAVSNSVPKIILVSGVHCEWAGIYALYNTMYEITTNSDLIDLKRNAHFIVMPMVNAYAGNEKTRKNANGIDIARNFEVDFVASTDTTAETYGGTEPLSELESQYVDRVMSENTDAWFFISCHNYFSGTDDYVNLWGSAATRYFHNLCQKLIDKLSREWGNKYSFVPDNKYIGASEMSAPKGSEGMHAIKYGIQGGTLECRSNFPYHSATNYTAFSQSRATEVYINFLLTALGNYEPSDKRDLKDYDGQR